MTTMMKGLLFVLQLLSISQLTISHSLPERDIRQDNHNAQQQQNTVLSCLTRNEIYQRNQWYINPSLNKPNLNVYDVWRQGITGRGIVVGVVDNGLLNRPELSIRKDLKYMYNYQRFRSYDDNYRGSTRIPSHGTKVAGVIASRPESCNSSTPIGIAYGSMVADLHSIPLQFALKVDLQSLQSRVDDIDIFSCSFTNTHTGFNTYPLPRRIRWSLQRGANTGRFSKGVIYVWATGNAGGDGFGRDSCAYDGYVNNPYVIPVAGVSHDLKPISNGEACSAIMVAAFTRDPARDSRRQYGITTLNERHGYTTIFGQNSAAVPMVSGVIALLLEANNELTYRDVMHLLVRTSRSRGYFSNDDFDKYFITNAANHSVSSTFGFGVIDALALVSAGRNWQGVPEQKRYWIQYRGRQKRFNRMEKSFTIDYTRSAIDSLEHVEVQLNYKANNGGQIKWRLISPSGTTSEILPGRNLDMTRNFYMVVVSNQFWDENPRGQWTLSADIKDHFHDGDILQWSITFYGYSKE